MSLLLFLKLYIRKEWKHQPGSLQSNLSIRLLPLWALFNWLVCCLVAHGAPSSGDASPNFLMLSRFQSVSLVTSSKDPILNKEYWILTRDQTLFWEGKQPVWISYVGRDRELVDLLASWQVFSKTIGDSPECTVLTDPYHNSSSHSVFIVRFDVAYATQSNE